MPTFTLVGFVYEGSDRTSGAINGATATVVAGLIVGRTAVTDAPAEPVEGWPTGGVAIPGEFWLNGVPDGTIRIRVTAAGYQPLEQDVTVSGGGTTTVNF